MSIRPKRSSARLDFSLQQQLTSLDEQQAVSSTQPQTEQPTFSLPPRPSDSESKTLLRRAPSLLVGSTRRDLSKLDLLRECTTVAPLAADARSARSAAKSAAVSDVDVNALLDALLNARDRIDDALDLLGAESEGSPDGSDAGSPPVVPDPESPGPAMDDAAMGDAAL